MWIASGWTLKVVSELIGHASVAITADRYGSSSPRRWMMRRQRSPRTSTGADTGLGSTSSTGDPRLLRVVCVLVVAGVLDEFATTLLSEFSRFGERHPVEVL